MLVGRGRWAGRRGRADGRADGQVYNAILRRFPSDVYGKFAAGGNRYATTIHVLVSAVVKIARVMRLPPGLELFRGLGGRMDLPDSFRRADANGRRGYTEFGFLSTTSDKEVAIQVPRPPSWCRRRRGHARRPATRLAWSSSTRESRERASRRAALSRAGGCC